MRRLPAFLLLLVLAATLSCRGLPLALRSQPPVPNEPEKNQQLHFICDFPLPAEDILIKQLQSERSLIYTTLALPPSDERITVHLYRNEDTYHDVLARKFPMVPNRRAFFVESDMKLHVYAQWSDRMPEDLRHEVAHGYLHASVPAIPLWIDEGLAEYFEVPHNLAGLNRPHLQLLADLTEHNGWTPNLERLESLSSAGEMQQEHYAEAWAWVYFLLHSTPERRELLTEYLAELRTKGRAAPLSKRLAAQNIQPQRTLAEYIVTLKAAQPTR
jgi:Protein of unknown function (DUF1570)